MSRFWKWIVLLVVLFVFGGFFLFFGGIGIAVMKAEEKNRLVPDSILVMELEGVIFSGKKFLEDLREYRKRPEVRGVIVRMDSPGGVVGPSQEIFEELKRVREEFEKPVIISCGSLTASGAYYAAVAGDKIFANPGTLMGSIGVIMEFANLEKLYEWAKIQRYVLKTGKFKDSGSEYRTMTDDEKQYLQNVIDQVLEQFKTAVREGRNLSPRQVDAVADGRIMTGEEALKLGLVDHLGTFTDAVKMMAELTEIEGEPNLFEPPKKRPSFMEFISGELDSRMGMKETIEQLVPAKRFGRPLFLMPGVLMDAK